ncbi:hypothetical protein SAMN04488077_107184 [Roseovarius tolerans]|uniref:DUF2125 domain-containing protein n=1 Tax=Roseovarius tolerans TaxID=74031 RepID=A0A1H8AWD3_9RHOB|nr:DUF2125 domain-containing protein [Roseovarius tolerans]SEM75062.1 hypothetical protein SAMN04488077_107184 [Roseovarius tolerans]
MSYLRPLAASAVLFGVTGTAALADLTADQVWQDWTTYLEEFGYRITADESRSGDTLTIRDLAMEMALPEGEGAVSMRMGQVEFVENGDGTVTVVLPETMPIAIAASDDEAQQVTMTLEMTHEALEMIVSGTPEAMQYSYDAEAVTMALTDLRAGEETPEIRAAQIRLEDLNGTSRTALGETTRAVQQNMTAGPVTYDLDFTDPTEGGTLVFSGSLANATFAGTGAIPESFDTNDMSAALRDGFRFDSRMEYQTGSTVYRFEDDGDVLEGANGSDRGTITSSIGPDGLRYGGAGEGVTIAISSSDMPFPVDLSMARMGFDIAMPVIESETMQDYAVGMELAEFTMPDQLWSLFDPGAQLPRDPATLKLDLSGKGRLFVDLFDPEQMANIESSESAPGEVESLTLHDLTLDVAGATLTGEGAFKFDQTDTESFGGAPAPEGEVDLRLVGGNGLLDKLIAMGLVPQDQATGVRMMMGLFARSGPGEDELVSKIEVTEDGQVLANGQRIK